MKFNALRDFLAVAERGSLRAAARHLGSAQPALSHSIQELEKELGAALFERRSTGVLLTDMGELFRRRAMLVVQELRRAKEEIDQLRGAAQGTLRLAMSSVPHIALLPHALRPFRLRYPEVRLEILDAVYPRAEAGLLQGGIDCYVGPAATEVASGLVVEQLFQNTRVIVGRRGHPLASVSSLRDLAEAEWISSSITYRADDEIAPLFAQYGLPPPRIIMTAHSALSFLVNMAYSDMLMLLPVQWTQSPLLHQWVQEIKVRETLPAPPICIVRRGGLLLTPAAEFFCDMLRRAVNHRASIPPP